MSGELTAEIAAWDFEHGRVRDMPKVYLDGRWHYQCRCGFTSLRHADHDAHRYAELERILADRLAAAQAERDALRRHAQQAADVLLATEAERDDLMQASWRAYVWSGADTDGDDQWHRSPTMAGKALMDAVESLRKDYDDALEDDSADDLRARLAERDQQLVDTARDLGTTRARLLAVEGGGLEPLLRKAARDFLGLEEPDYWDSGISTAQAAALRAVLASPSTQQWPDCATYPNLGCVCRGGLQPSKGTCTRKRTGDLTPVASPSTHTQRDTEVAAGGRIPEDMRPRTGASTVALESLAQRDAEEES